MVVFFAEVLIDQHVLEFRGVELYLEGVYREPVLNITLSKLQEVWRERGIVGFLWHVARLVDRRIPYTHHDVIDSSLILEMPESKSATTTSPILFLERSLVCLLLLRRVLKCHIYSVLPQVILFLFFLSQCLIRTDRIWNLLADDFLMHLANLIIALIN